MPPKKSNGGGNKKKKALGANRGFSTTSVPRKEIVVEPEVSLESTELGAELEGAAVTAGVMGVANPVAEEWSPESAAQEELVKLMDKIRPSSEKEIARMLKVIEYEKRLAKTYPGYLMADLDLQRRIVALALSEDQAQPLAAAEPEDKVVSRVAALYGILEQLGFATPLVEECLKSIKTLDLDDALEYLFLRLPTKQLECNGPTVVHSAPPASPRKLASVDSKPVPPAPAPPSALALQAGLDYEHQAMLKARILLYAESAEGSDDEEIEVNQKYATLKLRLSELQRAQGKSKGKNTSGVSTPLQEAEREFEISAVETEMKRLEQDYMFKRPLAENLFRAERTQLDVTQLSERLSAPSTLSPTPEASSSASTPLTAPSSSQDSAQATPPPPVKIAAEDSDEEESLFGKLLDEMPSDSVNDVGTIIPVYDMGLPKNFSGKAPSVYLVETVRKVDRGAVVVFRTLSRSRAVRAAVNIRWGVTGETEDYEMQGLACHDQVQAYNYIATVALTQLNPPPSNKVLPAVFRDLWDELVIERNAAEDKRYLEQLTLYKTLAEPRLAPLPIRDFKSAPQIPAEEHSGETGTFQVNDLKARRIMEELRDRQLWPSYQNMLHQRGNLPIAHYRDFIMQTIDNSQCVVLCGETGCGKSTQVPSFILEHEMRQGKDVKIFCTEPRRISAISLAQRVSSELGEGPGACGTRSSLVGYSIRLDSQVSASSRIIYATTGIVLRMLEGRESLADAATHLIIDEVHERSIDSDFLLIVLRQLLQVRKDLKVILMSATVDAEKIAAYMGHGCPVITVPGRTFPVSSLWLEDVVELTGYRLDAKSDSPYVSRMGRNNATRLAEADIPPLDDDDDDGNASSPTTVAQSYSVRTRTTIECMDQHAINFDLIVLLLENLCFGPPELTHFSSAILIFLPSLESIRRLHDTLEGHNLFGTHDFLILPLHSTISNENQSAVFDVPGHGIRKIVISTNLAETGVTIPDITCVIDTGKHREMRYDEKRQVSRLVETFIAQSNASQRRGRAGRVQEGICFHLFTKQRHDTIMGEHPQPEMMRLSLQDLALRIKIMKIGDSIETVLLQALDPPAVINVQRAIASLIEAKALTSSEEITPLGRHLAKLPMDVHLGKFLIMSCLFGCLDAALTITAALNSKSPWLTPFGRESEANAVKKSFKVEHSDFLTLYHAYCSWREACANGVERDFTRKCFLSQQNLQMIEELRQQYFSLLVDMGFIPAPASEKRDLIATRYGKSRIRFVRVPSAQDTYSKDPKAVMACLAASMYPKILLVDPHSGQLRTLSNSAPASIHPSSVNFSGRHKSEFNGAKLVTFFTAMATKKLYIWESGSIDELAVYLLCGNAEFQLPAHSLSIDRKIRVRLEPKTAIAFKILRSRFTQFFNARMKNPQQVDAPQQGQEWLELMKECLVTNKAEEVAVKSDKKVKVSLSLVRNA